MLFKRKPKRNLQLAITLCEHITDIAYGYKNDRAFTLTGVDIRWFEELVDKLWETHATVQYIPIACINELLERMKGQGNLLILK